MNFSFEEVKLKVDSGQAIIKYKGNRASKHTGYISTLVTYNDNDYLLCNKCGIFREIETNYMKDKRCKNLNHSTTCNSCLAESSRYKQRNDYDRYVYQRYQAILKRSKEYNVECCTQEEFRYMCDTQKELLTGLTIKEAFDMGKGNKLHVDHIKPISKGGESTMNNLRVVNDMYNRMKGIYSNDEVIAMAELILKHKEDILKLG